MVTISVEGVVAPIGVPFIEPPEMVAAEEEKLFAVKSPLTVVVANVVTP